MSTPYDAIPYPCNAHPQTHPDRLAAVARLRGLTTAAPPQCRYLEIGCGDGSNVLPLAYALPGSRFLGVDLAETSIAAGLRHLTAFGLKNAELRAMDVMDMRKSDLGEWDFIVAHGVFSWVPEFVRLRLLEVCRELLAPNGVALISYNAYPGCRVRHTVREALMYHTKDASSPEQKLNQGRDLLQLMTHGPDFGDDGGAVVKPEASRALNFDRNYFFHDDLAEINQPYYLHEFAAHATDHGLQYLGDAEYATMHDIRFPAEARKMLAGLGDDVVRKEQYLDFMKCRRFRHSLVCHSEAALSLEPSAESLRSLHFATHPTPHGDPAEMLATSLTAYEGESVPRHNMRRRAAKIAIAHLGKMCPEYVPFADLEAEVTKALGMAPESGILEAVLIDTLKLGIFEAHSASALFTALPTDDRPHSSDWAKYQSQLGNRVTTLRHETLQFKDPLTRWLLNQFNGERSIEDIAQALANLSTTIPGEEERREMSHEEARDAVANGLNALCQTGLIKSLQTREGAP